MSKNKAAQIRERRARKKRAARRAGSDGAPARNAAANATFAEVIEAEKLVSKTSDAGRTVIKYCEQGVGDAAKRVLKVISCHTCTAPKGCCKIWTVAYLHEAVPIAA